MLKDWSSSSKHSSLKRSSSLRAGPSKQSLNWTCPLEGDCFDSLCDLAVSGKPIGSD